MSLLNINIAEKLYQIGKKIVKRKFIRYLIISAVRSLITCVLWSDILAGAANK